jgi:hypothetical protein
VSEEYPADWGSRRRKVYQRDNYTCQNCGAKGGSKGNAELHAHHIVPKSNGGTHRVSNLKTLCKQCHEAVHGEVQAPTSSNRGSKHSSSESSSFSETTIRKCVRCGDSLSSGGIYKELIGDYKCESCGTSYIQIGNGHLLKNKNSKLDGRVLKDKDWVNIRKSREENDKLTYKAKKMEEDNWGTRIALGLTISGLLLLPVNYISFGSSIIDNLLWGLLVILLLTMSVTLFFFAPVRDIVRRVKYDKMWR